MISPQSEKHTKALAKRFGNPGFADARLAADEGQRPDRLVEGFEARGQVDRVADGRVLDALHGTNIADNNLTCSNAQ